MNYFGLLAGIMTLFIIGLGFPLIVYAERLLGFLWWPYLMALGILLVSISLLISSDWLAVAAGVLGATLAWGSTELKEQAIRAELGWFPNHLRKIRPPLEQIIARWRAPHL